MYIKLNLPDATKHSGTFNINIDPKQDFPVPCNVLSKHEIII